MCWWWCWGYKGHLQLFIDLPFLGLLLFLLIDTGLVKDIVFASILKVNWIWKLCVCFISVFIQTRFFLFDTKEGTPTWRSSNWSSFLFLQFWAATLDIHPFFYQSHIPLYHLVFAATADVSYLVLLLFRELAFAQEVLLSGLVRNSIIIATTIIVITIHHPHQITTWNSSMPVWTTICWSRVESPKSAASLSSLDRAWLLT